MRREVGLWIDHRQAVIVRLQDGTESIEHVEATFEKRGRYSSDMQAVSTNAPHMDLAEDKHERHINGLIQHYYEEVADQVRDAQAILIMGPGPAKIEFQKYLDQHKLGDRVVGVESVDHLTDAQLAAKVRAYFPTRQPAH